MNEMYRNHEGYFDPTAGKAVEHLSRPEKIPHRPIVYICSRYAGDTIKNADAALRYCRFAVSRGCVPIAPHLFYAYLGILDDKSSIDRKIGLQFGIILENHCKEVWVFGDAPYSDGMTREYNHAVHRGIRIRTFTTDCVETGGADGSI
ncbi:MAG: hypothetical protein LKF15_02905 [Lachnospiraceae bacterium]|jgi:hypothetical protein|nr:hypothetical protein [Lachnospiraceae bacterium]MCH4027904.1 hypothetical protein [Lachnospiraceae bacterium]MCH4065747.1 hypothetical protein [Lachnospiraceae bacterium]MCH4111784.1 hypothetical protein [Lachnospiraceae bacterium]